MLPLLLLPLGAAAHAAAPERLVVLHGGLTGLTGPAPAAAEGYHVSSGGGDYRADGPTRGAGVLGRITLHGERVALEAGAREALASEDDRMVGAIFFGARFTPPSPLHLRVGFAHNHETPMAVVQAQPVASTLGTAEGIRHRTGLEAGIGVSGLLPQAAPLPAWFWGRSGVAADLSLGVLPDHNGPHVYAYLDLTGTLAVGPRR